MINANKRIHAERVRRKAKHMETVYDLITNAPSDVRRVHARKKAFLSYIMLSTYNISED